MGYEYPHDDPRGGCASSTCPTTSRDAVYYEPSRHGYEQEIAERMERLADGADGADRPDNEEERP